MKGKITAAQGADRLILAAGVVLLIDSFLPWYGVGLAGVFSINVKGWSAGGLAVIAILLGLLCAAMAIARLLGQTAKLGSLTDGQVYLVLGGGAFVFTVLRFVTETSATKFGLYIAIVATAVLAFGGWQKFSAEKKGA
jgi:hypothetical protein